MKVIEELTFPAISLPMTKCYSSKGQLLYLRTVANLLYQLNSQSNLWEWPTSCSVQEYFRTFGWVAWNVASVL